MEHDIFGRLPVIALENKINLEYCLSFPQSPVPLFLCHNNGEIHKVDKSTLLKAIKSFIEPDSINQIDIDIIDGFYFLHRLVPSIPQTYSKIAELILGKFCNTCSFEIHISFDRNFSASLKNNERCIR